MKAEENHDSSQFNRLQCNDAQTADQGDVHIISPESAKSSSSYLLTVDGYGNPAINDQNREKLHSPLMSDGSLPGFTQDPMEIQSGSEFSEIPTPETESLHDLPISTTKNPLESPKENSKNPKLFKKSVSIVSPTSRKAMEKSQRTSPMQEGDRSLSNGSFVGGERTPLLVPCSSLPTVIGYDEASVSEYPGSLNNYITRSEIHFYYCFFTQTNSVARTSVTYDTMAKVLVIDRKIMADASKEKTENLPKTPSFSVKERPFIASPFMPIATQLPIAADRRSLPGSVSRNPNRNLSGYGSTRLFEEGRLNKGENSTDEDEDEEEDESSCGNESSTSEISVLPKTSFAALSSREWATIIMLALANLCSTVAFSCIAPFYPGEAAMKGMTESQTGMVFGVFELVMFVTAPLFGKYNSVVA
uniref:MFS domain-containing protein n=1 Tax=Heterorhabditis bacteriophora TaxID=37862 RepID=A0A1I7XUL8_HETBA